MEPAQILQSHSPNLEGEVWLPLMSDPAYSISNLGRIKGLKGKLMRQSEDTKGYLRVQTAGDYGYRQVRVSKAVLEAFVGPCPYGMQAAHLNGNKLDNRLDNLKWCTPEENEAHKVLHGTRTPFGELNPNARFCDVARTLIYALHIDHGMSMGKIGNLCGLSDSTINRIVHTHKQRVVTRRPVRATA